VEGLVHISSMADDYYRYLEASHTLRGENTEKVFRLGDKVRVQVVRVDLERRQIDLGLTDILDSIREDEGRRGPRRSKARLKKAARPPKQRPGRRERATRKAARKRGRS
jgi:ribonuclease R